MGADVTFGRVSKEVMTMADETTRLWVYIQEWLDLQDRNQAWLAKRLDLGRDVMTRWKYGQSRPDKFELARLAAEIRTPYALLREAVIQDIGYPAEAPDRSA